MWNELKEIVGVEKLLDIISELPKFYFKPRSFFVTFFEKENKEKVIQLVVYSFFFVLVGYILAQESDWKYLTKWLLFELIAMAAIIVVLWLANMITSIMGGTKVKATDILFFSFFIKLLIVPFQLLFFELFVLHENYNYFFIQNLVVLVLYVYYLGYSGYIFQSTSKFILINIVANILVLNAIYGLQNLLSIDNYYATTSPYYQDQILKERVDLGRDISDYYSVPTHRILYKLEEGNFGHFLLAHPFDTISHGTIEESNQYHKSLKEKISILDSMIDQAKFVRNQDFFRETKSLYLSIDSLMEESVVEYTNRDVSNNTVYLSTDSNLIYQELLIRTPYDIQVDSYKLLEKQIDLERNSYYAFMPLIISEYFIPISLLFEEN